MKIHSLILIRMPHQSIPALSPCKRGSTEETSDTLQQVVLDLTTALLTFHFALYTYSRHMLKLLLRLKTGKLREINV